MSKKTTIRLKKARKLNLDDVFEFAGVKYRVYKLWATQNKCNVVINAIDIDAPDDLCYVHRKECEVQFVINKDRKIPVLK